MEFFVPIMYSGIDIFSIAHPAEVGLHCFAGETTMNSWHGTYYLGLVITGIKEIYSWLIMLFTTFNKSPFVLAP